jgi:hypothetical protein
LKQTRLLRLTSSAAVAGNATRDERSSLLTASLLSVPNTFLCRDHDDDLASDECNARVVK